MMENILDDMSDHRVSWRTKRFVPYIVKNRLSAIQRIFVYGTLKIDTHLRYNKFCPFSLPRASKRSIGRRRRPWILKRETHLYR